MIHASDIDTHKPMFQLIRILGQLKVAGLQRRSLPLSTMLIHNKDAYEGRRFCIKFDNIVSLNIEYVAMVPWKDRDPEFEQFYR